MALHTQKKKMENIKEIPFDIMFQIISGLPFKALNRFKCVSTSWSSMILHHMPSCGITLTISQREFWSNSLDGLYYAPIHVPGTARQHEQIGDLETETFVHQLKLSNFEYENVTPVVNGLACLFTGHQASIFDISTCEIVKLPSSSLHPESRIIQYALGFDPIDNVYKLFKVTAIPKFEEVSSVTYDDSRYDYQSVSEEVTYDDSHYDYQLVYEILTLETISSSTLKWREIVVSKDLPSFSSVKGLSYFVNGVIFWKFRAMEDEFIIGLDVHQENLAIINRPPTFPAIRFGQFEGRLATCHAHSRQSPLYGSWVVDLWVLEDHQSASWTKVTINLPAEVQEYFDDAIPFPIGNLPSGELLLLCLKNGRSHCLFYTYDPITRNFVKLMIELRRPLAFALQSIYPAHMSVFPRRSPPTNEMI